MKIVINIEAESAEDARKAMLDLIGQPEVSLSTTYVYKSQEAPAEDRITISETKQEEQPAAAEAPKTRSRRTKAEIAAESVSTTTATEESANANSAGTTPTDDPLASPPVAAAAPVQSNDPLASASASVDPLGPTGGAPAPSANGTPAPAPASNGAITFEQVRHKIAACQNKTGVRELVGKFKKEDGAACYGPSDLQEKDWADFMFQLELL